MAKSKKSSYIDTLSLLSLGSRSSSVHKVLPSRFHPCPDQTADRTFAALIHREDNDWQKGQISVSTRTTVEKSFPIGTFVEIHFIFLRLMGTGVKRDGWEIEFFNSF